MLTLISLYMHLVIIFSILLTLLSSYFFPFVYKDKQYACL